jgi:hypothetical protein
MMGASAKQKAGNLADRRVQIDGSDTYEIRNEAQLIVQALFEGRSMVSYLFNDRNFEALEHAIQVMSFGHVTSNQFDTR